jgi:O-antigen/teichoic acid export membrane protein
MQKETHTEAISGSTKQTIAIMTGKIIALLATFSLPLFLTRFLTKYEYGIFSQFYVVVTFCIMVFCMGIQSNLYFFYPTANKEVRKSLIVHTWLFLLFFSIIAIGLINIPVIGKFMIGEGDLNHFKALIIVGIILLMPVNMIEPLYVVKNDNIASIFYPPAEVMLRLSFVVCFALVNHNLYSILIGVLFAALTCFSFVTYYSLKGIKIRDIRNMINLDLAKNQLKYSIPFGLALSLNTFALQLDKIICISFLTPAAFATYSIAFYGIPGVQQIYNSLSQVYLIKMTVKYQENKLQDISDIYKSLVSKTYSFSIPSILLVSLYAKRIITLFFTNVYVDAVPLFRTYLFSFLIFMLGAGLILRATDKTIISLKSYFYSSLITIPLTYYLIKHFGMWGGMTSAMFSIILPKTLQLRHEMKFIQSSIIKFFPWKTFSIIALISCIALIPFVAIEFLVDYGPITMAFLGLAYLAIVSWFEIKYNVFVFDNVLVINMINGLLSRIGFPAYKKKEIIN